MKDRRPRRSPAANSNPEAKQALARNLHNEFLRNGWSRSDIVEFVNLLLDNVLRNEGRASSAYALDPETGFPTRQGFQELLLGELHGNKEAPSTLVLMRLASDGDILIAAERLRTQLRRADVVAPLGQLRVAVLLRVGEPQASSITERIAEHIGAAAVKRSLADESSLRR